MLVYASTKNRGKLREFLEAARQAGLRDLQIQALPRITEIPQPEETGSTFEQNAVLKACYYSQFTDGLVFADDSGLAVDSLHGEPGVRSARYAGEAATDAENNALLLRNLSAVTDRSARFICVIALARAGQVLGTAYGSVEGEILQHERGED